MFETIKNILMLLVVLVIAIGLFIRNGNEKQEKKLESDYAAERAWKGPLVNNCENAVRKMADGATLKFGGVLGSDAEIIDKTDSGYIYYLRASDSTSGNVPVSLLCYTDHNGQVIRVVPRE